MCNSGNCELKRQVQEIHDAIIGENLHKNDGIIDRLIRLELWKKRTTIIIGVVSGLSFALGFLVRLSKLF